MMAATTQMNFMEGHMSCHASQTEGIHCLQPRVSNNGIPLVYLCAKRENLLAFLSNGAEHPIC